MTRVRMQKFGFCGSFMGDFYARQHDVASVQYEKAAKFLKVDQVSNTFSATMAKRFDSRMNIVFWLRFVSPVDPHKNQ